MRLESVSLRAIGSHAAQSGATFLVLLKPAVLHDLTPVDLTSNTKPPPSFIV